MAKIDWKNEELIREACRGAETRREILQRLGLPYTGGSPRTLNKYAEIYGIELPHGGNRRAAEATTIPLEEILVRDSSYTSFHNLKRRLVREGILEYKCAECECVDWMGKPISLQLDHINGERSDNRIENLRLLCPNCHSQTDTWGRKKRV